MQLTAFEIAIFSGVLGVGATLSGVIISYYLSISLAEKKARLIASIRLRAAFAPIIAEYNSRAREGCFYLQEPFFKNALVSQSAAIEEYRWFVLPERQRAFQQAWENYHCKYGGLPWTDYVDEDGQKLFKQRIDAILKFTED